MKNLETYTASELQTKSGEIYNRVIIDGAVIVRHRSKPDMILMTVNRLAEIREINLTRTKD